MIYDLKSTYPNPKWYQLRRRASNVCLWMAKKLYPENPKVYAFLAKQMMDMAIYGGSITHIDYPDACRIHDEAFKEDLT